MDISLDKKYRGVILPIVLIKQVKSRRLLLSLLQAFLTKQAIRPENRLIVIMHQFRQARNLPQNHWQIKQHNKKKQLQTILIPY